jgi:hypothetical protein
MSIYSLFYTAELQRLYPFRKHCLTFSDTLEHLRFLVHERKQNIDYFENTKMNVLLNSFFLNSNVWDILEAIKLVKREEIGLFQLNEF